MRALVLLLPLLMNTPASAADKRPMTLDDMFAFKRVSDPQISPDGKQVVYVISTVDVPGNKTTANLWLAATDGSTRPRQLTTAAKKDRHPRWSPDGKRILFESNRSGNNQLWLIDLSGGEAQQLTNISTSAGTGIWSRDGTRIAFVSSVFPEFSSLPFSESDKKNKEKLDAAEKNPVKAKVFNKLFYRHWDEYVEDKRQHLFVIKVKEQGGSPGAFPEPHDATPGDRDANPTSSTFSINDDFTFSADGKYLLFTAVPPKNEAWSTNYEICRVSIDNTKTEWEPVSKNPAADGCPRFSRDGKKLAWRAQKRRGYEADKWEIMVAGCHPDGTLAGTAQSITGSLAKDVSISDFAWGDEGTMIFTADLGGSQPLFMCWLKSPENAIATLGLPGANSALSVSSDGKHAAFMNARMTRPGEVFVCEADIRTTVPQMISKANDELLAKLDTKDPESVTVGVEGGPMQMWIVKPPGFDQNKKWPVAYLVHGGPQGAWEDSWSFRWNPTLWAAQGYIVALPNPRGSTGFGQKFTDDISGDWGGKCYRDLMASVDYVEKLPYVDKDRIAAAGASFGGYMMDWFAVNTGRFKTLISHCSVWDFESMWGTTDELWFDEWEHSGLPWEVPGKYREFSPHAKAGNLGKFKTPMLLIQNDLDFRCPVGQGQELFSALQRQGVPSKLINFPDEGHWVLKPANSKYWHEEVFAWLKKYVPPGPK